MRLIDADMALEALIEKGQASKRYKIGEFWEINCQEIKEALNTVPSVQLEMTGCKGCKHLQTYYICKNDRCARMYKDRYEKGE